MRRSRSQRGFTLIEIIITIVIVAFAVVGLVAALSFTAKRSVDTEVMTTATELAQERMEQVIADRRANGFSSATLAVTAAPSWVAVPGFAGYEQMTEICYATVAAGSITKMSPCTTASTPDYKYITVTARYTALASTITADMVTVITNY